MQVLHHTQNLSRIFVRRFQVAFLAQKISDNMASVQLKKNIYFFFLHRDFVSPYEVDNTDILQHYPVYYSFKAPNQCRQVTPKKCESYLLYLESQLYVLIQGHYFNWQLAIPVAQFLVLTGSTQPTILAAEQRQEVIKDSNEKEVPVQPSVQIREMLQW